MKLSDLKAGDTVILDNGFTCHPSGSVLIQEDEYGQLYFLCSEGKHYLDGQIGLDQHLIGVLENV